MRRDDTDFLEAIDSSTEKTALPRSVLIINRCRGAVRDTGSDLTYAGVQIQREHLM